MNGIISKHPINSIAVVEMEIREKIGHHDGVASVSS